MKTLTLAIAVAAATALAQTPNQGPAGRVAGAGAQAGPARMAMGRPGLGPGLRGPRMAGPGPALELQKALSLTDDQGRQLRAVLREQRAEWRKNREAIAAKADALAAALDTPSPDAALVGRLTVELKSMREAQMKQRPAVNEKALAVLTAEQKQKLETLKENPLALQQAACLGLVSVPAGLRGPMGQCLRGAGPGARRMMAPMNRPGRGMRRQGPPQTQMRPEGPGDAGPQPQQEDLR